MSGSGDWERLGGQILDTFVESEASGNWEPGIRGMGSGCPGGLQWDLELDPGIRGKAIRVSGEWDPRVSGDWDVGFRGLGSGDPGLG